MPKPFNINLNNVESVDADGELTLAFKMISKTLIVRNYKTTEIRDKQHRKICNAMNSNLMCGDI